MMVLLNTDKAAIKMLRRIDKDLERQPTPVKVITLDPFFAVPVYVAGFAFEAFGLP